MDALMHVSKLLRIFVTILLCMAVTPFPVGAMEYNATAVGEGLSWVGRAAGANRGIEVLADKFGIPLSVDDNAKLYSKPSVLLQQNEAIEFKVTILEDGLYTISFDVAAAPTLFNAPEGQLLVDGQIPSLEATNMVFPVYYKNSSDTFPLDEAIIS